MPLRNQFDTEKEWLDHLRMYFAAKAMQTLLVDMDPPTPEAVSEWAYRHADAMLKARKQ